MEVGEWDVKRIESLVMNGVNPDTGREALLRDVQHLFSELGWVSKLPALSRRENSQTKTRLAGLKKRLMDLESWLKTI